MADSKLTFSFHGERKAFLKKLNDSLKELYKRETVQLAGTKPDVEPKKYASQEVTLDDVYVKLHILAKAELERRVGSAAVQGSVSEMMRFAHAFSEDAKEAKSIELASILELAADERYRLLKKKGARVLALAGAGVGKTMSFLKKAGLEWARGNIWNDMDLVFALPLRQPSVHSARTLQELLSLEEHGFHVQTEREQICQHIDENLSRVCLILDGLDEIDLCQCSDFVLKVIKGIALDGVRLIVTSRPSIEVMELAKAHPFNQRVEVLGFNQEELERYVGKVLNCEDADALMRQVSGNPQLCAFMQVPVNAAHVCSLYRSGTKTIPTTLPAITTAILRQTLALIEPKRKRPRQVAEKWSEINPDLLEPVNELAAFAFRTLVDKVTVFEKRHFDDHQLSPEALSLGLLVACDNIRPDTTPQWVFSLLILHEALAAYHIASTTSTTDVPWLVQTLGSLSGHLNTFWRFLAAQLDSAAVDTLLSSLFLKSSSELSTALNNSSDSASSAEGRHLSRGETYFLSASHAEMHKLADKLSSHLTREQGERLADHLLSGVVCGRGKLAVESTIRHQGKAMTGATFLAELLQMWKTRVPRASIYLLHSAIATFDESAASNCFPDLATPSASQASEMVDLETEGGQQVLLLACHCYHEHCAGRDEIIDGTNNSRPDTASTTSTIASPVFSSTTASILCNTTSSTTVRSALSSSSNSSMTTNTATTNTDVSPVSSSNTVSTATTSASTATTITSSNTTTGINTNRSCTSGSSFCKFRQILERSGGLDFDDIHLTPDDCCAVGFVLHDFNRSVTVFTVKFSRIGDNGYAQLASGLIMCQNITELDLVGNNLSDRHKDHVAMVILNNSSTLRQLAVGKNHFTSLGSATIHGNTHYCGQLELLWIGGSLCADIKVNISTLCSVLPACPHLTSLFLCHYRLDVDSLTQLHTLLSSHNLQHLSLVSNDLTMDCFPILKLIIAQHRHSLTGLVICGNTLGNGFFLETQDLLQSCSSLQDVLLADFGLTSQVLPLLASLLRSWSSLAVLFLMNNDFTGNSDGAESFGSALQSCPRLLRLWMPDEKFVSAELQTALTRAAGRTTTVTYKNVVW